ncbi:hypothetical protein P692DRAFT_201871297 [Suillus brevipes Sb2]|nr:hypothetical protein P692DRAFT_201871297 [Suillus brevipes Sb2]
MFKGWIDDKSPKMNLTPVAEDESDHDADDESPRPRPTRKPTATRRITKRPRVSSTEEESEKTDAEVSPPTVTKPQQDRTHAEDSDRSSDRPTDKRLDAGSRAHEGRPTVSHHRGTPTAKTLHSAHQVRGESDDANNLANSSHRSTDVGNRTRAFGPSSTRRGGATRRGDDTHRDGETRRGLEHIFDLPMVQEPSLMRTTAARDVSPATQAKKPRNLPAPREPSPRKAKAAKVAAALPLNPPAKGTRSNAETSHTTRTRQKPKRYNDYI